MYKSIKYGLLTLLCSIFIGISPDEKYSFGEDMHLAERYDDETEINKYYNYQDDINNPKNLNTTPTGNDDKDKKKPKHNQFEKFFLVGCGMLGSALTLTPIVAVLSNLRTGDKVTKDDFDIMASCFILGGSFAVASFSGYKKINKQ